MDPITQFVILFMTLLLVIFNIFDRRSTTKENNNLADLDIIESEKEDYLNSTYYELEDDTFINKKEIKDE